MNEDIMKLLVQLSKQIDELSKKIDLLENKPNNILNNSFTENTDATNRINQLREKYINKINVKDEMSKLRAQNMKQNTSGMLPLLGLLGVSKIPESNK